MLLLWIFLFLVATECQVVYRTRWPKYVPKKTYHTPRKPLDYCNGNLCPGNVKHLTCDIRFWADRCGKDHEGIRLTEYRQDIEKIVNDFRRRVERGLGTLPRAARLPLIRWDEDLSVLAMRVTNQCKDHSFSPCVNTFRHKSVGESSDFVQVRKTSKGFNVISFLKMWFDYYKIMKPADVRSFPDVSAADHLRVFANLIYEKNTYMGCGMLKSKEKRFLTCLFNSKIPARVPLYRVASAVNYRGRPRKANHTISKTLQKSQHNTVKTS
ncbi:antigen 5 like allergen Cul n 1 [Drosophila biarmipes]|uniref:antigen 5 like allergen Cul n 1 n=1 Tax=Drosophila biarmipes TaxID=125945 RepID=UPI0007E83535|nr:antigen 5 like allergen Cul n 1 [Drosophila biarmipes]